MIRIFGILMLQIVVKQARRGRIAPPFGKSDHFEDADAVIEPDRQHVTWLDGVAR
jgi:hypothetical protein